MPANGVGGLTKNLALLELVEPEALPCGACGGDVVKAATVYCVECEQKLCRDCEEDYENFASRPHKTVDVNTISTGLFVD